MDNPTIIIPAYQPTESVIDVVKEARKAGFNIIIVDDGSGDSYRHIFDRASNEYDCRVLTHVVNQGKGRALKTAFNYYLLNRDQFGEAGIITVDADGQHRIQDVKSVSEAMKANPEGVVMGCRNFNSGGIPLRSRVGNNISKLVYRYLCGIAVTDTQTGLRGIPLKWLDFMCGTPGERYEYETNMLLTIRDNNIPITELEIETIYEKGNPTSHFNPLLDSLRIYAVLLRYSLSSVLSVVIELLVFAIATSKGGGVMLSTYIARFFSSGVNFAVNKKVVFRSAGKPIWEGIKYILLLIVSSTISGILVYYFSNFCQIDRIIAKVIVDSVLFFVNYYLQRTYVFTVKKN